MAQLERWFPVVAGSALVAYGLKRRDLPGYLVTALGGVLVWRGIVGNGHHHDRQVSVPYGHGIQVEEIVTINAPPDRLYSFWRNFENLPRFMDNLESVEVLDDKRSRWVADGPAGLKADWEAEIINEIPNELIGWRSVEGSRVDNAGSVHFTPAPGGRGTEVKVVLRYDPPGGKAGAVISRVFGEDPARQVQEDLRRLKVLVESGEIATIRSG